MPERKTVPYLVLDTSALISYLLDERGADLVASERRRLAIPFVAMTELYYWLHKKQGRAKADQVFGLIKAWNAPILYPNESVVLTAGRLKAQHSLGLADSYIAAFAVLLRAELMTKDNDYRVLSEEINIRWI